MSTIGVRLLEAPGMMPEHVIEALLAQARAMASPAAETLRGLVGVEALESGACMVGVPLLEPD